MKKKRKAFSLIELIIVSSILIIVSTSGVFYFTDFIEELSFKKTINSINDNLETLDNKISKKEIFDYEIEFSKWKLYYEFSENIFDLNIHIDISNTTTETIEISFSWATSGSWIIKYYEDYKFKKAKELMHNWTLTGNIVNPSIYKIIWSFSGNILNTINFQYFDNKKLIKLVRIDTNNNSDLNSIKISNILWKKDFWDNPTNNKAVLYFEDNNWKIETLEIKK